MSPFFIRRCFIRSFALTPSLSASSLTVTPSRQRDLAGRPLELEHLAGNRRGLLARVAALDDGALRLSFLVRLRHHDVRAEVVVDDLRSGERTFREQLAVDFGRTLALAAFAGGFFFGELLAAVRTPLLAAAHRAARQRAGRWRRSADRTVRDGRRRDGSCRGRRGRSAHRTAGTRRPDPTDACPCGGRAPAGPAGRVPPSADAACPGTSGTRGLSADVVGRATGGWPA